MESGNKSRAERVFGFLLRLFPSEFREDFGDEMRGTLRSDHAEALERRSRGGPLRFWWSTLSGVVWTAPKQHLDSLRTDLRYALRMMRKRPVFTLTAVVSLAIGIGATTTVMAVFNAAFLRQIPGVERSENLVNVKPKKSYEETFLLTSFPVYQELRDGSDALAQLAVFHGLGLSLSTESGGEPEPITAQLVTPNYFPVIGASPLFGRFFTEDEDAQDGAHAVAVISAWLWQSRFNRDPAVLGGKIWLNGVPFSVVGIAPEGFRGHFIGFNFDVFVPTAMAGIAGLDRRDREGKWVELIGRTHEGTSLEQARAGLALDAARLAASFPDQNKALEIHVERATGHDADLRTGLVTFLAILIAVSGFVLVIACVNVANLLLAHVHWRRNELALRLALGAPRRRLARQLMTESLLLAVLAGVLGSALAVGGTALARNAFSAVGGRVSLPVHIDAVALITALAIAFATALAFGVAPAWRASRANLAGMLHPASRVVGGRSRLWGGLVVSQVVLSFVVLVCAGLFLRVLQHASSIDPGFDAQNVYFASFDPRQMGMEMGRSEELFRELASDVRALPGVESAALLDRVPLSLGARFFPNSLTVNIPGWEPPQDQDGFLVEHSVVSAGYFDSMGIAMSRGRDFTNMDQMTAQRVAVVNEAFVERFGQGVGGMLRDAAGDLEIVAVVATSKYRRLDEQATPHIFLPYDQQPPARVGLVVRHSAHTEGFPNVLRSAIRARVGHLPIRGFGPLQDQLSVSLMPQRIAGATAGLLGIVGLLLTAIGLHGVVAYSVARRANEIGVRMSLGATRADILRMVLRQSVILAVVGVGIGVVAAAGAARFLVAFLVGVSPVDLPTFLAITGVLLVTCLAAGYFPARRASLADPLQTLRAD